MNPIVELCIRMGGFWRSRLASLFSSGDRLIGAQVDEYRRRVREGNIRVRPDDIDGEFIVAATSDICVNILKYGAYDRSLIAMVDRYRHQSGTVVVVGANIGVLAVHIARTFPRCECVLAIEPDPAAFALLQENIVLNDVAGKIIPIEACAWRKEGRLRLMSVRGRSELSHVCTAVANPASDLDGEIIEARAASLTALVGYRPTSLIVIDVGGAEFLVLLGAREIIDRDRPALLFSCRHGRLARFGSNSQMVERLLNNWGFECREASDARLRPIHPYRGRLIARHRGNRL